MKKENVLSILELLLLASKNKNLYRSDLSDIIETAIKEVEKSS